MKISTLAAAVGATLLVTLVAVPTDGASAGASYNYGTRATPLGAVAGGARFAAVARYAPVGISTRAPMVFCSTGVPWRLADGTRGFLTAGHCLPGNGRSGAQIMRSAALTTPWVPGAPLGARTAGMTTSNTSGTIPGKVGDIAFVPSKLPVGNFMFDGGPTARSMLRITSWMSKASSGYRLCISGFRTGVRCDLKQGTKTSYRDSQGKYTGLAEAYYSAGNLSQRCAQPGDSGGVVYRLSPDGRSAYVVGIISGGNYGSLGLGCSTYYTPLGAAQKQFGGGPIIS